MYKLFGILLIILLSTYKTLFFYFWHDDFSWFYLLQNNTCFSFWPYNTFCHFLGFFYQTFGYNAFVFHLVSIVLLFLTVIIFFLLCKSFFEEKTSFFLAAFFATVYIGSGAFVETHSPFLVLTPLIFLILSLITLNLSYKNHLNLILLTVSIIIFGISVFVAPIRSSTHIFPLASYIFLFFDKISIKKRLILVGIFSFVYFITFFILPLGSARHTELSAISLASLNPLKETSLFFQTIGSALLTDEIIVSKLEVIRLLLGILISGVFIFFWKRGKTDKKIGLFALIWIIFFYLPYGLKFDERIPSNHRYLLSMFPGIALAWGIFSNFKYWKYITIVIILFGIVQSNIFFTPHLESSKIRSSFYSQLHLLTKDFTSEPTIFFDFSPAVKSEATDFFRVGYYPSEAALGTEFKIPHEKINLILDDAALREHLSSPDFKRHDFFSYYYDGKVVTQTTNRSQDILKDNSKTFQSNVNKFQNAEFVFDKNTGSWTSTNKGVSFTVADFVPILPSKLSVRMSASTPQMQLPYTQGCIDCIYNPTETRLVLDYLTQSKKIKNGLKAETSNAGEKTKAESIIDSNPETFWLANRQEWFKGKKPTIKISLKDQEMIEGLALSSTLNGRLPKNIEVKINEQTVDNDIVQIDDKRMKIIVKNPKLAKEITITILETNNNDSPIISDINILPRGFGRIDVLKVDALEKFPSLIIKTDRDVEFLKKYLSTDGKACIEWQQTGYGMSSKNVDIFVDGQTHTYDINLPAGGINTPKFLLGCLNYPVDVEVQFAKIEYLKGNSNL